MDFSKFDDFFRDFSEKEITLFLYQVKTFKVIIPQVLAVITATSFNLVVGMGLAFSGILIPDIQKSTSEMKVTQSESSWIASVTFLSMALSSPFSGFSMDILGRLGTIRLSAVPIFIGWVLIALARNIKVLFLGRILIGIGFAFAVNVSGSFICEISFPQYRASFLSISSVTSALGVELLYLFGLISDWRTASWVCAGCTLFMFCITFCIYESPSWLISKRKNKKALKALRWYLKYQKIEEEQSSAELHYFFLKSKNRINDSQTTNKIHWKQLFTKPVFKPVLIMIGLFLIQQFSGIYVFKAFAVTFFEEIGCNIPPTVSTSIATGLPVFFSILNIVSMNIFRRKILLIISCIGISISLLISSLFTKWIHEGSTKYSWVPVLCIFIFMVMSIIGLEPIPWDIISEVVPLENRGIILGFLVLIIEFIMFLAAHSFLYLQDFMGITGVQLLYSLVAFYGAFYVYFYVPETHNKTMMEIENSFHKQSDENI